MENPLYSTLKLTGYDKEATCRKLGISQTTLWRRLKMGYFRMKYTIRMKKVI